MLEHIPATKQADLAVTRPVFDYGGYKDKSFIKGFPAQWTQSKLSPISHK